MRGPIGKNTAEDAFVDGLSLHLLGWANGGDREVVGSMHYPKGPYHNCPPRKFARQLSRMTRRERLLARGFRQTLRPVKPKWEREWPNSRKWSEWR